MPKLRYFRRIVGDRVDVDAVIYAVRVTGERQDPVPALGYFPPPWAPTPLPGQLLATNPDGKALVAECLVRRSQFRHYTPLTEAEARAGWPALVAAAERSAAERDRLASRVAT